MCESSGEINRDLRSGIAIFTVMLQNENASPDGCGRLQVGSSVGDFVILSVLHISRRPMEGSEAGTIVSLGYPL